MTARDFHPIGGYPWVLVCTSNFEATVTQFSQVIGLKLVGQGSPVIDTQFTRYAQLTMPDGCIVEVVEPRDDLRQVYQGLIYSIAVSDVYLAKASMEREGIVFTTDVFNSKNGWGWAYFRAADGQLYQLQGPTASRTT